MNRLIIFPKTFVNGFKYYLHLPKADKFRFPTYSCLISRQRWSQSSSVFLSNPVATQACGQSSGLSTSLNSTPTKKSSKERKLINEAPKAIETFTCISFYHFVDINPGLISTFIPLIKSKISELNPLIRGTLLIATEGINAAFVLPRNQISAFQELLFEIDPIIFDGKSVSYNIGKNIEIPLFESVNKPPTMEDARRLLVGNLRNHSTPYQYFKPPSKEIIEARYDKIFRLHNAKKAEYYRSFFPFKKLLVKQKKQILTDGLFVPEVGSSSSVVNWKNAGDEVSPEAWHKEIMEKVVSIQKDAVGSKETPLILGKLKPSDVSASPELISKYCFPDCRNKYESDIGTCANAIPLNTTNFSETWEVLDQLLKDVPKDQRLLTFCTGGIRCVKVNAYLKEKLGYNNIGRLEKGIIAYESWLEQQKTDKNDVSVRTIPSIFVGENFLFDRRRILSSDVDMEG